MAILSKYKLEKYQYGVHVRKKQQLYGMSGKLIYNAKWIIQRDDPIIIVEMNQIIAEREARFYLEVNHHHHIIQTFGYIENTMNSTIFIQEFAIHTDLAGVLMDNPSNISQTILLEMFRQITNALSYIASKQIIHGDLGCRNVLVFQFDKVIPENNRVKITDFGLARWMNDAPTNEDVSVIPIRYCAPEILRTNDHTSYSEKSDVYSLGVLIWEALSNSEIPYSSIAADEDVKRMKLNNTKLEKPSVCDHQFWVLMNSCWHKQPQQRPSFEQINDKLHHITISEVPHSLITASSHKTQIHCDYELDIDVEVIGLLNNDLRSVYEARWISEEERPIVVIKKDEEPSEYELLIYTIFKDHSHIIHTFGFVANDEGSIMILQERAPHGNLQTLLESGQFHPSPKVLVEIFLQIINAMLDIIAQGLVHGDLRCENILVFNMHPTDPKRNRVKLTNFTLAHRDDSSVVDERRLIIPVRYCAPEIIRSAGRSNYTKDSDAYSMGVLMWQACSKGKIPYESSITNSEVRQRKLNNELLPRPPLCHEKIWYMMESCWFNEPTIRYNFQQMHEWFTKINLESTETYQYILNINVKQKRSLNGSSGKFYEADCLLKKDQPVILIIMPHETAEREADFCMRLNSSHHIVQTFGFVKNDLHSIILLQERALHGNLQTLLQNRQFHPSSKVLIAIFLQIVDAMIYVTSQNIVHSDLRCGNVLVFQMHPTDPSGNLVKLTSFSLSRTKDEVVSRIRLPNSLVRYLAPELLRYDDDVSKYSELSDVYSMGILMWEGLSKGEVPYGSRISDDDVRQLRLNDKKLLRPKDCSLEGWKIIDDCFHHEPELRYNFTEIQVRLTHVPDISIHHEHCYRCNEDIPQHKMNDHQQQCVLPMPTLEVPPQRIVSSTTRKRDNKENLNNYIEYDHRSRQSKHPRREANNSTDVLTHTIYYNDGYETDTMEDNQRLSSNKQYSTSSPSIPYPLCKYCNDAYPDCAIKEHEMSHCRRRPRSPVITRQPKSSHIKCENCNNKILNNQTANHKRSCRPISTITTASSKVLRETQPTNIISQFTFDGNDASTDIHPSKPKSRLNRILPCVCC